MTNGEILGFIQLKQVGQEKKHKDRKAERVEIGKKLKSWRESIDDLTQAALAELLGVDVSSVVRWEKSETGPTNKVILRRLKELMGE